MSKIQDTYYAKNRAKVLERERVKRLSESLETKMKKRAYNHQYYIEVLKYKRSFNSTNYNVRSNKPVKNNYSFTINKGSFIINFD